MNPTLKPGIAVRKKKPTAKSESIEVDKKALKTAIFIEQIEMFNLLWNRFEDARGWSWTQEHYEDTKSS